MMWIFSATITFIVTIAFCSDDNDIYEIACSSSELPCDAVGCIPKGTWCDSIYDCSDGSDENFCASTRNPDPICSLHHFKCDDGTCVPMGAKCDNYSDCRDKSDESPITCNRNTNSRDSKLTGGSVSNYITNAVKDAETWILSQRNSDYGWGEETARAVVSLNLVNQRRYEGTLEGELIKKQLMTEITADLIKNKQKISLSKYANYVNALIATCQSPNAFQGLDLTLQLRSEVNSAMHRNGSIAPLVFLTLCLVGDARPDDFTYLYNYFTRLHNQKKIDLQAVALMGLSCLSKHRDDKLTATLAQRLAEKYEANKNEKDVYTTALVIQALNSASVKWQREAALKKLLSFQRNGSFGDILATYYALPAILNKSLLSLRNISCSSEAYDWSQLLLPHLSEDKKEIKYSLWFGNPVTGVHTMSLRIDVNWSFLNIMRYAAKLNPIFSFLHEETGSGPSVYSIANNPNDAELNLQWTLYRKSQYAYSDQYTDKNLTPFDLRSKPDNGDHVVMWYRTSKNGAGQF